MTCVLIKRALWTQPHTQGEHHVNMKRDWGDAYTNSGIPEIASKTSEARREDWS